MKYLLMLLISLTIVIFQTSCSTQKTVPQKTPLTMAFPEEMHHEEMHREKKHREKIHHTVRSMHSMQRPGWFYVIQAQHSILKRVTKGIFTLTVPKDDIQSVLTFSAIPVRSANRMAPRNYVASLLTGTHVYSDNLPKMVVVINQTHPIIMKVESYDKSDKEIIYKLISKMNTHTLQDRQWGSVIMFIDSMQIPVATPLMHSAIHN